MSILHDGPTMSLTSATEGGTDAGRLVVAGTPEQVPATKERYPGRRQTGEASAR